MCVHRARRQDGPDTTVRQLLQGPEQCRTEPLTDHVALIRDDQGVPGPGYQECQDHRRIGDLHV